MEALAVQIANATFAARHKAIWGEGSSAVASDSTHFGAWDQNLVTEWHSRYGGRGVLIYWHIERKSMVIHSQLLNCSASEVAAMMLSRIADHGSYLADLFPGMMVTSVGLGALFVGVTTAANAGVPADRAGLAAALMNASQQVGGALGLAIFSAIATARTNHLLAEHTAPAHALTGGFHRALLAEAAFLLATALVALRTANTRGEQHPSIGPAPQGEMATLQ